MQKISLTGETYRSVLDMLNSSDQENVVMGLSIIEETNRIKGMACILMLKKSAKVAVNLWNEHAPQTCLWMKSLDAPVEGVITYKKILEIITHHKVETSQMQFFMDEFGKHLFDQIKQLGYDFVEDLEIKLKLKTHAQQDGQSGESL